MRVDALQDPHWSPYETNYDAQKGEEQISDALDTEKDELWNDSDFPNDSTSLYTNSYPPGDACPTSLIRWKRIFQHEICGCNDPEVFKREGIGKIVQGSISNAWLLNSLCVLASRKPKLEQIIVSTSDKSYGILTLRFFFSGKWRYVHIDDKLPCTEFGRPLYSTCADPNEMWLSVIEKAYAKLLRNYQKLERPIAIPTALRTFTSTPSFQIKINHNFLFEDLYTLWHNDNVSIGCSKLCKTNSVIQQEKLSGILSGRMYGISGVEKVEAMIPSDRSKPVLSNESDSDEEDEIDDSTDTLDVNMFAHFVRIRDYFGDMESRWNGFWRRNSEEFDKYVKVTAQVNPSRLAKNETLVSFKEFVENFDLVYVNLSVPDSWICTEIHGKWIIMDDVSGSGGAPTLRTFGQNPHYYFSTGKKMNAAIEICRSTSDALDYFEDTNEISWLLYKVNKGEFRVSSFDPARVLHCSNFTKSLCSSGIVTIKPGFYCLIPMTASVLKESMGFSIRVFSSDKIEFEAVENPFIPSESIDDGRANIASSFELPYEIDDVQEPSGRNELRCLQTLMVDFYDLTARMDKVAGDSEKNNIHGAMDNADLETTEE